MTSQESEGESKEMEQLVQQSDDENVQSQHEYVLGLKPGQFKENFKKRVGLSNVLKKLDKLSKRNFKEV